MTPPEEHSGGVTVFRTVELTHLPRRLLQVTIPEGERLATETTIAELMGKDAAPRFAFIMEHAAEVENWTCNGGGAPKDSDGGDLWRSLSSPLGSGG